MRGYMLMVWFAASCGDSASSDCADGYVRSDAGNCIVASSEEDDADGTEDDYEGDDPGECSDSADNDRDGLFDCDDEGCAGAPECQDADADVDADADADGDADIDALTVDLGPVQSCSSPERRASQPFVPAEWGSDWSDQHTASTNDAIAASGLTVGDFTGDGVSEIYIPQVGDDQLYVRQSDGTYVDEASERLPDVLGSPTTAGTAFDIEGDGDLDLFISRREGGHSVLLNDGTGHFADATNDAGFSETAHPAVSATVADIDGDGDLDVFVATFRHCDLPWLDPENPYTDGPQALWVNEGSGAFSDASDLMPEHPGLNARLRAAAWFDADLDGAPDLYTISDKSVTASCQVTNQLFYQEPTAFSEDAASASLDLGIEGMGVALGDLNGDAYPELAISDMNRMWLMESDGAGGWYDGTAVHFLFFNTTLEGRWSGWGVELEDINNDGLTDLFMGFGGLADVPESATNPWGQPDGLWLQDADGRFDQQANDWGVAGNSSTRAVVLSDVNADGWLDLLTREIGGEVRAWLAQCGEAHWVDVRLRQNGGNARAVGAIVTVKADGVEQRKWMTAGSSGLQSSKPLRAHFGLGSADVVDVAVQWPDGETTLHESIEANRVVTISRP